MIALDGGVASRHGVELAAGSPLFANCGIFLLMSGEVVLGAHGGRAVTPILPGAVARQVLAYSSVPVLMLRDGGRPEHTL